MEAFLFGDEPHVFVGTADAETGAQATRSIGARLMVFCPTNEGYLIDPTGTTRRLSDLAGAPSCPAILVACSSAGHYQLGQLLKWWSSSAPFSAPPLIDARCSLSSTADGLAVKILAELLRNCRVAHSAVARTVLDRQEDILTLRAEVEELGHILTDYRRSLAQTPSTCKLTCRPGQTSVGPKAQGVWDVRLPCDTWGLARLDLYFCQDPTATASGSIVVTIEGVESQQRLGCWRREYDGIATGWQIFAFPVTLSTRDFYINLSVAWRSRRGDGPALVLSEQLIQPSGQPSFTSEPAYLQLPALRLWVNLPALQQDATDWAAADATATRAGPNGERRSWRWLHR